MQIVPLAIFEYTAPDSPQQAISSEKIVSFLEATSPALDPTSHPQPGA